MVHGYLVRFGVWMVWALALCLVPFFSAAQDDTLRLDEFEVISTLDRDVAATSVEKIELSQAHSAIGPTASDFLLMGSGLTLRGYGPGSSFGLSIRGSSASQTQVLIDGIPFQNPSLAQADLSLLPIASFSELTIYRGSAGAYLGNGAIGGSLMMDTDRKDDRNALVQGGSVGSFGALSSETDLQLSGENWKSTSFIGFNKVENDFLRADPSDRAKLEKQPNARFESKSLLQKLAFDLSDKTKISALALYTKTFREIPPGQSQLNSVANQNDEFLRLQTNFDSHWQGLDWNAALACDMGKMGYTDAAFGIDDPSRYRTLFSKLRVSKIINGWNLYAIVELSEVQAESINYRKQENRRSPAVVAGFNKSFFSDHTQISAALRQETLNGDKLPLLPNLALSQKLGSGLSVRSSAGRSYRLPGINDLYWNPGGNAALLPESGWYQEAGIDYSHSHQGATLSISASAYHRLIENWIQWQPGASYFSPKNLKSVESKGIELTANLVHAMGKIRFEHHFFGTVGSSVNKIAAFEGDKSVGRQLIYTPQATAFLKESVWLYKNRIGLELTANYVGRRYVSTDNRSFLEPYCLLDLGVTCNAKFGKTRAELFAKVRNIADQEFQLQASHPLPGINAQAGLKLRLNLDKND